MKKTILTILLCIIMILGITGCNFKKELDDSHTFLGTILECRQEDMIVRPNENEDELKSSDKFTIQYVNGFNACSVGNIVKITYNGGIKESYPAQINTTNIEVINDFDFYISKLDVYDTIRFNEYYKANDRTIYLAGNIEELYIIDDGLWPLKDFIPRVNQTFESSFEEITDKLELKAILKDGGTKIYKSKDKDITMVVCKTLKGNNDIYIGDYAMEDVDDNCN